MSPRSSTRKRRGLAALALGVAAAGTRLAVYLGVAHAAVSPTMHAFVHQDASIGLDIR